MPVLVSLIAAVASIYGVWAGRNKVTASTYHEMAQTIAQLNGELQELRVELNGVYAALDVMRSRMAEVESESEHLRDRVRKLERYLRRLITQLRREGHAPDVPQEVIDELFSGSASGAGV